ncbi:hypothetical protein [Streptomyces sp. PR69]|uniref:hypothetical protein n=1 Tax=Streptomyces sp. PR69 TaxID=2984950 RepID=UPI0022652C67|nr:hypothetical protein [Streptomyces sp. PR69]
MSSTENSHDSPRSRRSAAVVVSVAAAVLVAGGGAYLATSAFGGGDSGRETAADDPGNGARPPVLALEGAGDGPADRPADGAAGIAPGEPDPSGGVVYRAKGSLPKGPDSAAVHRAQGTVTEAEVTRLAEALGLSGTPRLQGTVWKVGGDKDGDGPLLQVNKEAPGTWTYGLFGAAPGSDNCVKGKTTCPSDGHGGARLPANPGSPSDPAVPSDPGTPVSEQAAKQAAAPVLKALGQDDAKLDARQLMGAVRVVNADPVVGGLPTYGWSTGVQVGPDGRVTGGSGQLKEPRRSDSYPVVPAEEALKRLNEGASRGPIGIGGCATPVPVQEGEEGEAKTGEAEPVAPCEPDPSRSTEVVLIDQAVFGLAARYVDGRQALVPSWLFEVEAEGPTGSFTITHPAVAAEYLKEPGPPKDKGGTPPVSDRRVLAYSADGDGGRELTVWFWGGVCSSYAAEADERDGEVAVRIVESVPDPGRACIALAKELTATVTLEKPLGERKVVDAESEEVVPAH